MLEGIRRWGPALLVMAIIFILSGTPKSNLPEFGTWDMIAKKAGHMLGYGLLASSFAHALNRRERSNQKPIVFALCLAFLYAASDELHQSFVQGRSASLLDVAIDTFGAALGLVVWSRIPGRKSA